MLTINIYGLHADHDPTDHAKDLLETLHPGWEDHAHSWTVETPTEPMWDGDTWVHDWVQLTAGRPRNGLDVFLPWHVRLDHDEWSRHDGTVWSISEPDVLVRDYDTATN